MATRKNKDLNLKETLTEVGDTNMEQTNNTNIDTTESTTNKFVIKKKVDEKKGKKAFNVYMQDSLVKDLDKLSKKTGYSRNELINMMCQECVNNYEIVEE